MIKILVLVLLAEIVAAVGQVLFKKSTNTLERYSLRGLRAHTRFLTEVLAKPSIWAGILSMAVGLVIWLIALAQGDLSVVFSIGSLQYILILFSAHVFLGEKIDAMKVTGTLLVVLGIMLITIS
jgi:uncharacterized membrane protein